jgi:circadian clock protein KaiB
MNFRLKGGNAMPAPEPWADDLGTLESAAAAAQSGPGFVLRLYVTGLTVRSERAIAAIKDVCESHLQGRYDLKIVDLSKEPETARREQIVAAPTLVRREPLPLRRLVGDMSDRPKVLNGLGIQPAS